jgi:hypothetical protein
MTGQAMRIFSTTFEGGMARRLGTGASVGGGLEGVHDQAQAVISTVVGLASVRRRRDCGLGDMAPAL